MILHMQIYISKPAKDYYYRRKPHHAIQPLLGPSDADFCLRNHRVIGLRYTELPLLGSYITTVEIVLLLKRYIRIRSSASD